MIKEITSLKGQLDIEDAEKRLRGAIWFRGANVWILACAIILASVGLNVNSVAVIIGAMLISPVMGPIVGIGLSLGTNDTVLLRQALRNLLVMVGISLMVATLYFLISPLQLTHPTELEARTSPTIYDVIIAFFGGLAGILENCRKERGTVLSGVAIATALMPPLCTAGFGLATWQGHFLFGALYLFLINSVFIILATYLAVKYLHFPSAEAADPIATRRGSRIMKYLLLLFVIPSIYSAVVLVKDNNFTTRVNTFLAENEKIGHVFLFDQYKILKGPRRQVEITVWGQPFTVEDRELVIERAETYGIQAEQLVLRHNPYQYQMPSWEELGMPDPESLTRPSAQ